MNDFKNQPVNYGSKLLASLKAFNVEAGNEEDLTNSLVLKMLQSEELAQKLLQFEEERA